MGYRQDVAFDRDLVSVWNWYETNGQLIRSVEKSKTVYMITVITLVIAYATYAKYFKNGWWYGVALPIVGIILVIGSLRGGINATINGGMTWRDSKYNRDNLKPL
ncbi:hypothetical protein [Chengkuizengella axinellae]|uniref:DUF2628 domain-containing protein n=1 Tax=Chengkuizengella axinellae TaxID=3064388 RepID=A0ABT9J1U4_9BACL|nr:hypothetical protein [Chengkuizengella sp. 2205SS18-9]MDP5275538.1 hypothetical protein [Chengkuizengella sp. 2205SS18-9]